MQSLQDGEPPPPPGARLGTPSRLGRAGEGPHGGAMTVVNLGTLPPGAVRLVSLSLASLSDFVHLMIMRWELCLKEIPTFCYFPLWLMS
jgi:hypothetical protein